MNSTGKTDYTISAILSGTAPDNRDVARPASGRRRTRTVFSLAAIRYLEHEFELGKYPDIRRREMIGSEIGVPEARVQVWFQNRRARNHKRRNTGDQCTDDVVPRNARKRQRVSEQPVSKCPGNNVSMPGLASVTSASQSSPTAFYRLCPNLMPNYHGVVLASLWNLQNVTTSLPPEATKQADEEEDIVKRLFRFSARDYKPVKEGPHQQQKQGSEQVKQVYRMVVPTKKASGCSMDELRHSEGARDVREEGVFTLEDDDSGLANDSFSD